MKYYLLLVLTSFIWSGSFVLSKFLVLHASPITLTSLRWLIAVICLLFIVWWKEKKILPKKNSLLPLFLMGLTGVTLFQALQFLAFEYTTATNVGLLSALNMFSIAIFSYLFFKEKINLFQFLSMLFSLIGVLLVLSKGNLSIIFSFDFNIGDVYMLVAVAIWGLYSICSKWAMKTESPIMATLYSGIFGILVLLPFNLHDFTIKNINAFFTVSILYIGIVATVLGFMLWNIGIQHIGANTSGLFLNFNPIFTATLSFIFLGEKMNWMQGIGIIIVIAGCYLFTRLRTKVEEKVEQEMVRQEV